LTASRPSGYDVGRHYRPRPSDGTVENTDLSCYDLLICASLVIVSRAIASWAAASGTVVLLYRLARHYRSSPHFFSHRFSGHRIPLPLLWTTLVSLPPLDLHFSGHRFSGNHFLGRHSSLPLRRTLCLKLTLRWLRPLVPPLHGPPFRATRHLLPCYHFSISAPPVTASGDASARCCFAGHRFSSRRFFTYGLSCHRFALLLP
jgi:hypothetical protein